MHPIKIQVMVNVFYVDHVDHAAHNTGQAISPAKGSRISRYSRTVSKHESNGLFGYAVGKRQKRNDLHRNRLITNPDAILSRLKGQAVDW